MGLNCFNIIQSLVVFCFGFLPTLARLDGIACLEREKN